MDGVGERGGGRAADAFACEICMSCPSHICLCVQININVGEKTLKLQMTSFALSSSANTPRTVGWEWAEKVEKRGVAVGGEWMLRVLACYIDILTAWWSKMSDKLTARCYKLLIKQGEDEDCTALRPKKKTTTTVLQKHIHIYTRTRTHKYKWACKSGQLKVNKWVTFFRDPNQCQRVLPLGIHLLLGEKLTTKWFVNREISIIAPERNRII